MCIGIPGCENPQVELMDNYILCSKCCFEIVAPGIVSSAHNVHIFTMFETLHSHQNMLKVLKTFESPINNMQHKDFTLPGGIKVKAFLNGGFKMLNLLTGHQASASYPSNKNLLTLNHFQNTRWCYSTVKNCKIELRENSDFMKNFVANIVDYTVGPINKKEKYHFSIIETHLIPITTLSNIVPPVLHITLGIVLKLFEMILSEVRKLDCNHITEVEKLLKRKGKVIAMS